MPKKPWFNEITKDAVKNAFKEIMPTDMDLVDAQQARRVLDRICGYSISPILWKKVKKDFLVGRVQSVVPQINHWSKMKLMILSRKNTDHWWRSKGDQAIPSQLLWDWWQEDEALNTNEELFLNA